MVVSFSNVQVWQLEGYSLYAELNILKTKLMVINILTVTFVGQLNGNQWTKLKLDAQFYGLGVQFYSFEPEITTGKGFIV